MKNLKLLLLTVFAGSLFVISCSKKGDKGATGATGATGPDSVIYSGAITLKMSYYSDNDYGWSGYVDSIAVPALTQEAVSKDLILGYLYVPNGFGDSAWVNIDNDEIFESSMASSVGKIVIQSWWSEFNTGNESNDDFTGMKFRYVIVPANVLGTYTQLQQVDPSSLKKMDYSHAMTALGVKQPTPSGNVATSVAQ